MTVADALLGLLALVAGVLLFVGLAEVLEARPRPSGHRRRAGGARVRRRLAEPRPAAPGRRSHVETVPPGEASAAGAEAVPLPAGPVLGDSQAAPPPGPTAHRGSAALSTPPGAAAAGPFQRSPRLAVIDRCVRLHEEGEHTEALAVALQAVHPFGPRAAGASSLAVAVLWTLVALARRALAEPRQAREALAAALSWAPDRTPEGEAGSEAPRLGLLAALLARRLVTEAAQAPEVSEETLADLGLARALTRAAALVLPEDRGVAEMAERAQEALWGATEEGVRGLLSRREFGAAHRLVEAVLASGEAPAQRAEAFRELLWTAVTGEVGRLVGRALAAAEQGADALEHLGLAEAVLRDVPGAALGPEQCEDLQRRLWWGAMKAAGCRLERGDPDGALPALDRALALAGGDPERSAGAREALARALGERARRAEARVEEALGRGDRGAAEQECRRLLELIRTALDRGVGAESLEPAMAALRQAQDLMAEAALR